MEVDGERMESLGEGYGPGLSELGACRARAGQSPTETSELGDGLILGAQAGGAECKGLA